MGAASKYANLEAAVSSQLVVVLDGVEDPHNLGAIIRTAHAAGAGAVIIPERRAAGVTDVVAKAAAGALEYLPITRVTNINRALEELAGALLAGSTALMNAVSEQPLWTEACEPYGVRAWRRRQRAA